MTAFYIPAVNYMGKNCLEAAIKAISSQGFKKGLIVTDEGLVGAGIVDTVQSELTKVGLDTVVYSGTKPNPTVKNVNDGLAILKEQECDFIVSLGGGSPHDCAKGIALLGSNGGKIEDYEGVDVSEKPQMPLIAINTTAGTASEMTRFCIITDETRHIKMAIVDKHTTPIMSVNDPMLMMKMPQFLTAATGMDALTHAIEAYVSTAATPVTDAMALKAISMIKENLLEAVHHGTNEVARENMAYAQFMAGCAFNNASLGYVHAMAHQLGGLLDLPHGLCNAILLPVVQEFNMAVCSDRLKDVAIALGVEEASEMCSHLAAKAAIKKIRELSKQVGTAKPLSSLGAKEEHLRTLAENALKDACSLTNPRVGTVEEVIEIFRSAM